MLMIHMPLLPDMQPCGGIAPTEEFVAFHADIVIRGFAAPATETEHPHRNGTPS